MNMVEVQLLSHRVEQIQPALAFMSSDDGITWTLPLALGMQTLILPLNVSK